MWQIDVTVTMHDLGRTFLLNPARLFNNSSAIWRVILKWYRRPGRWEKAPPMSLMMKDCMSHLSVEPILLLRRPGYRPNLDGEPEISLACW